MFRDVEREVRYPEGSLGVERLLMFVPRNCAVAQERREHSAVQKTQTIFVVRPLIKQNVRGKDLLSLQINVLQYSAKSSCAGLTCFHRLRYERSRVSYGNIPPTTASVSNIGGCTHSLW